MHKTNLPTPDLVLAQADAALAEYEMLEHGLAYGLALAAYYFGLFPAGEDDLASCLAFKDDTIRQSSDILEAEFESAGVASSRYVEAWLSGVQVGFGEVVLSQVKRRA